MKKIMLANLTLTNFKGIRQFTASFGQSSTNIFGDNATGKTTLFDAFLWLLFGKDSTDRKDFEIKTLDDNNQPYHNLIHSVEATLFVDGIEISLRREFREKWTKKRGSTTEEFTGHETGYFWNDVPLKQEEYQSKISGLLNEGTFKLITNTNYFNSMKWQDRRAVLIQMAGVIDDMEILDSIQGKISNEHNAMLLEAIAKGKNKDNFKEYRAELGAKKKKVSDELKLMPSRIQEANLAVPEQKDYAAVQEQIDTVTADIANVEELLSNKSAAYKQHQDHLRLLIDQRAGIQQKLQQLEFDIKSKVQQTGNDRKSNIVKERNSLRTIEDDLMAARKDYMNADGRKKTLVKEQEDIRAKWNEVNTTSLVFNENEFCCPACKREFDPSQIEQKKAELTNNFNSDKSKRLNDLTEKGQAIGKEIVDLTTKLDNLKSRGEKLSLELEECKKRIGELEQEDQRLSQNEISSIQTAISENVMYASLLKDIETLSEQINAPYSDDNSALLQRKADLSNQLNTLNRDLAGRDIYTRQVARVQELKDQESKMATELAAMEGVEFSINLLVKTKMDEVETRVNSKFRLVRFKMFEEQINGGEVEACTTLVKTNGAYVPYSDVNTAGKIQAGIDIINALSEYYGTQAPVWVDNRESVVLLPETDCQLINLIVSESDKKLRVVTQNEMAAAQQ